MNYIHVWLPDFRAFVRSKKFKSEENVHPVFYWIDIDETIIKFYKPEGGIIYVTTISTDEESLKKLPVDITIKGLIQEFEAIQIPIRPDAPIVGSFPIG